MVSADQFGDPLAVDIEDLQTQLTRLNYVVGNRRRAVERVGEVLLQSRNIWQTDMLPRQCHQLGLCAGIECICEDEEVAETHLVVAIEIIGRIVVRIAQRSTKLVCEPKEIREIDDPIAAEIGRRP